MPLFELVRTSFRQGSASYRMWSAGPTRCARSSPSSSPISTATRRITPTSTWSTASATQDAGAQRSSGASRTTWRPAPTSACCRCCWPLVAVLRRVRQWGIFALLAVLSLLFAFGTPLYAVLFYGLPGYNQLHSAFRWVYPFTLCIAVLAGLAVRTADGGDAETRDATGRRAADVDCWARVALIGAARWGCWRWRVAVVYPAPFVSAGRARLAPLRPGAGSLRQRPDVPLLPGAQPVPLLRLPGRGGRGAAAGAAALALVAGGGHRPAGRSTSSSSATASTRAAIRRCSTTTPAAVAFLQQDDDVFRVATLGPARPEAASTPTRSCPTASRTSAATTRSSRAATPST